MDRPPIEKILEDGEQWRKKMAGEFKGATPFQELCHYALHLEQKIKDLEKPLPCGHPVQCTRGHGKGSGQIVTLYCGWCADIAGKEEKGD